MNDNRHKTCITIEEYEQWAQEQTNPSIYSFLSSLVIQNNLSTTIEFLNKIESALWLNYKFPNKNKHDNTNITLITNDNGTLIPGGRLECFNSLGV